MTVSRAAIPVAPAQARWRRFHLAETDASDHASAACHRPFENIGDLAIVVTELKFGHVQWQAFAADPVIGADDAVLDERPEALDCLSVHSADHAPAGALADDLVRESPVNEAIA
jgi:hypothetical protein